MKQIAKTISWSMVVAIFCGVFTTYAKPIQNVVSVFNGSGKDVYVALVRVKNDVVPGPDWLNAQPLVTRADGIFTGGGEPKASYVLIPSGKRAAFAAFSPAEGNAYGCEIWYTEKLAALESMMSLGKYVNQRRGKASVVQRLDIGDDGYILINEAGGALTAEGVTKKRWEAIPRAGSVTDKIQDF